MSKSHKMKDGSGKMEKRESGWAWQKANAYKREKNWVEVDEDEENIEPDKNWD